MRSSIRPALPWLALLAALALPAWVFGLGRTVPPMTECGGTFPDEDALAAYRSGIGVVTVIAEALALTALVVGLRASAARRDVATALGAVGTATAVATAMAEVDIAQTLVPLAALAAGVVAALALDVATGRHLGRSRATTLALVGVLGATIPALLTGLLATYVPDLVLTIAVCAALVPLALLLSDLPRAERLTLSAAIYAGVVLPAVVLLVVTRGDVGPPFC